MTHNLVIEGKIVSSKEIYEGQIGIDNGVITAIKKQGLKGERRIEAKECLIFPGFIDVHAHLREDDSHLWDYKEDFGYGTMAAVHGGITTIVDMPNTPSPGINSERIKNKKELAAKKGLIDVLFCGAITPYNIEKIEEMQKEVVAYKIYLSETGGLYMPKNILPKALSTIEKTSEATLGSEASKPVILHCEDQDIIDKKKEELKVLNEENYSDIRPKEAEISSVKIALSYLLERKNLKINIAHVSVYDTLGIFLSAVPFSKIKCCFCEVTPHHLFFNNSDILKKKGFLKTNPPLRVEKNRLLLLQAFFSHQIDFLSSDHAPHTREEKREVFLNAPSGVPNLDTYGNFVAWLLERGADPKLILKVNSFNPAMFLGLDDRGAIEIGKSADITILDTKKEVKISSENLYTKCGWSPFEGFEFHGAIKHTISNGEIKSEYDEVFA